MVAAATIGVTIVFSIFCAGVKWHKGAGGAEIVVIALGRGGIDVQYGNDGGVLPSSAQIVFAPEMPKLVPQSYRSTGGLRNLFIPLWMLGSAAAVVTVCLRPFRKRRGAGVCPACGYDVSTLTSGQCPECGGNIG